MRTPHRVAVSASPGGLLHRLRGLALLSILVAAAAAPAAAQARPLEKLDLAWIHDSGLVRNAGGTVDVVESVTVHVTDSSWLRVFFDDVELAGSLAAGDASILRITSHYDGATQELNAVQLAQWQDSSAYFNGDTVQVEIVAHPGTGENRLRIDRITAGTPSTTLASQCGPNDDRGTSTEARACRIVPIGCTGWLFDGCRSCFGTAGHCNGSTAQVAEFNVPASTSNGTIVHPPPEDQYSIDLTSKQTQNAGTGNDWGVFGVFANTNTGLTPFAAQGGAYSLADTAPAFDPGITIRITGFGVDSVPPGSGGGRNADNQTNQTHTGPFDQHTGTLLRYVVDTQGGNSGSPVVDTATGKVIGVHTHAGCSTSGTGSNQGTAIEHTGWQSALDNPQGVCALDGSGCTQTYCQGKLNSFGCVPFLTFAGQASESSTEQFGIVSRDLVPNQAGLLVYGFSGRSTLNFHNGTLCVKAPLKRLFPPLSSGSAGTFPCGGLVLINFNKKIQTGSDPLLIAGQKVNAQFLQRDPTLGDGFNDTLTNGIEFTIMP